ncbi:MAG: shikimate dehydrogenase [Clostridiales bacterium]|nr:shikimate dehydrogenase [Clostridiales bacterium]
MSIINKFYVVGDPIEQSFSPTIHNTVFKYLNLPYHYDRKLVNEENIDSFVKLAKRDKQIYGFSVTHPNKQLILPFIDELGEMARVIGAANCVAVRNGLLFGYNTDGNGYIKSIMRTGFDFNGAKVKIIGAGGAARSIIYSLLQVNIASLTIYNRSLPKAVQIASEFGGKANVQRLEDFSPIHCDLLINATSVGMQPHISDCPVDNLDGILPDTFVSDIIYSPERTKFLQMAEAKGCAVENGLKMLILQALISEEIWFERNDLANNEELIELIEEEVKKEIKAKLL